MFLTPGNFTCFIYYRFFWSSSWSFRFWLVTLWFFLNSNNRISHQHFRAAELKPETQLNKYTTSLSLLVNLPSLTPGNFTHFIHYRFFWSWLVTLWFFLNSNNRISHQHFRAAELKPETQLNKYTTSLSLLVNLPSLTPGNFTHFIHYRFFWSWLVTLWFFLNSNNRISHQHFRAAELKPETQLNKYTTSLSLLVFYTL